jgi:5-methylcytosine-specific restriction endonuclease McrA
MDERESRVPRAVREAVFELAGGCCEYCLCQAEFSASPFSIEHVVPRADGGSSDRRLGLHPPKRPATELPKSNGTDT